MVLLRNSLRRPPVRRPFETGWRLPQCGSRVGRLRLLVGAGTACTSGVCAFSRLLADYTDAPPLPPCGGARGTRDSQQKKRLLSDLYDENCVYISTNGSVVVTRSGSHVTTRVCLSFPQVLPAEMQLQRVTERADVVSADESFVTRLRHIDHGSSSGGSSSSDREHPARDELVGFSAPPSGASPTELERIRSRFFPLICGGALGGKRHREQRTQKEQPEEGCREKPSFKPRVVGFTLKAGAAAAPSEGGSSCRPAVVVSSSSAIRAPAAEAALDRRSCELPFFLEAAFRWAVRDTSFATTAEGTWHQVDVRFEDAAQLEKYLRHGELPSVERSKRRSKRHTETSSTTVSSPGGAGLAATLPPVNVSSANGSLSNGSSANTRGDGQVVTMVMSSRDHKRLLAMDLPHWTPVAAGGRSIADDQFNQRLRLPPPINVWVLCKGQQLSADCTVTHVAYTPLKETVRISSESADTFFNGAELPPDLANRALVVFRWRLPTAANSCSPSAPPPASNPTSV